MSCDTQLCGIRVLVIDDNADARELVQLILSAAGATTFAVGSAGEAVEHLGRGQWDVVICDICMPGESGLDLLRCPHVTGNATPVIAHTALASGDQQDFTRHGFAAVVPKPFDPAQLIRAVLDVLPGANPDFSRPDAQEPFSGI